MGFIGEGPKPDPDDALAYKSSYWDFYQNVTSTWDEMLPEIIEEQQEEVIIIIQQPPKQYEIDEYLLQEFLCSNTEMTFKTNPFD